MKLTGELKDKVDQTQNLEEAKDVIAQAGMLLTDDEVSEVAGGAGSAVFYSPTKDTPGSLPPTIASESPHYMHRSIHESQTDDQSNV
jgi:hypothetical protein